MTKPYYITTPLYYVNAKPHIGHAYTNILCDTFARFHRLMGEDVFFMTGTDEHGTKINKAAAAAGKEPKAFVDSIVPEFKQLWDLLEIRCDYFIRTTDPDHKQVVQNILCDLETRGEIYLDQYKGWYCTPCESFWTKLQLADGKCPDCRREVQELEEENYFFKLSKYQSWLVDYIRHHPKFIRPQSRQNEILSFLKNPLEDLCISRPKTRLRWGIPFPNSDAHVVYVWFDALINYISGVRYSLRGGDEKFKTFWPADIHVIGKDILRQHAVYWPMILKAIGVEMPGTVLGHGWWTFGGAKVSKSRGNIIDPVQMVKKYTADGLRYYLLREVTLGLDGTYSEKLMTERYNTDLANDLGNLLSRSTAMVERYFNGVVPTPSAAGPMKVPAVGLWDKVKQAMCDYDPRTALSAIWEVITEANRYVEISKPWVLAKEKKTGDLGNVLYALLETQRLIGFALMPFLPAAARTILESLGIKGEPVPDDWAVWGRLKPGTKIHKADVLFPKREINHAVN